VTGSSHCTLVPYWAARLGKDRLSARQVSSRAESSSASGEGLACALPDGLRSSWKAGSRSADPAQLTERLYSAEGTAARRKPFFAGLRRRPDHRPAA